MTKLLIWLPFGAIFIFAIYKGDINILILAGIIAILGELSEIKQILKKR
jgi:hypothetical protein